MADISKIEAEVRKIEGQFRRQALWKRPAKKPPQIQIKEGMDETTAAAAKVLNRIFYIRSLPACARMFGHAKDSAVFAFNHDYKTAGQKVEYARVQLNQLISDIAMIAKIDSGSLTKIES
jgi:hypothetical protein